MTLKNEENLENRLFFYFSNNDLRQCLQEFESKKGEISFLDMPSKKSLYLYHELEKAVSLISKKRGLYYVGHEADQIYKAGGRFTSDATSTITIT